MTGSVDSKLALAERLRFRHLAEVRSAAVAVAFGIGCDLTLDQLTHLTIGGERDLKRRRLVAKGRLLLVELRLLQARELAQSQVENGGGLLVGQRERRHERGSRRVLLPDDADHFVEVPVSHQESVDDVQAGPDAFEPVFQAPPHRRRSERQPLDEEILQREHAWSAVASDDVEIHPVGALEIGRREQMAHQTVYVDPVRARR